jgi:hypothetical protein
MSERRPPIQEVNVPEFVQIFGEIASAKSLTMKELSPAVAELLKSIPVTIRAGVEEWRKTI